MDGFHSWGWAFFVFWLATAAFWVIRVFSPQAIALPDLQFPDWQLILAAGIIMLISGLLFYTAVPSGSVSAGVISYSWGVAFGWFIALIAAVGVCVGAYMRRNEAEVVPAVATSTPIVSAPPPVSQPSTPPDQEAPPPATEP